MLYFVKTKKKTLSSNKDGSVQKYDWKILLIDWGF